MAGKRGGKTRGRGAATAAAPVRAEPDGFAEWQSSLTPREQRVQEIVGMMSQGQWFAGASHRQLAKAWGVHPGTVEHLAAEANRLLRYVFRTDDDARKDALARGLQNFETIRVRAMVSGTPSALRVALEANESLLRYLGLEPPKNVRVAHGEDDLSKLTDEQLERVANGEQLDPTPPANDDGVH